MLHRKLFLTGIFSAVVVLGSTEFNKAADVIKPLYTFGTLRTSSVDKARERSAAWLKSVDKFDANAFNQIWANESRSVLDRTIDSLLLGSTEAAALLGNARDPLMATPVGVPGLIRDAAQDPFFRANIATAYAKALSQKRIYEEALEALKSVQPELAVDPSSYYFFRAVAEHALIQREPAMSSVMRLLDDVADAPDRYKMVATLMFFDMQNWSKDAKDLANIERLMDNSGRRLDLARGGPVTQDIQKKIVFRLDEAIKELENKAKSKGQGSDQCPPGEGNKPGPGSNQPNNPAQDSQIMTNSGQGKVDEKKLRKLAEEWGKLPQAKRAEAIQEITRDLPPKYKPMIEEYFKSLNRIHGVSP